MTARPQERGIVALFVHYWLPVLAYVALITALSAQPHLKPPFRFRRVDSLPLLGTSKVDYKVLREQLGKGSS